MFAVRLNLPSMRWLGGIHVKTALVIVGCVVVSWAISHCVFGEGLSAVLFQVTMWALYSVIGSFVLLAVLLLVVLSVSKLTKRRFDISPKTAERVAIALFVCVALYLGLGHMAMSYRLAPLKHEFAKAVWYQDGLTEEIVGRRNEVLLDHGYCIIGSWRGSDGTIAPTATALYVWFPPWSCEKCLPAYYNYTE